MKKLSITLILVFSLFSLYAQNDVRKNEYGDFLKEVERVEKFPYSTMSINKNLSLDVLKLTNFERDKEIIVLQATVQGGIKRTSIILNPVEVEDLAEALEHIKNLARTKPSKGSSDFKYMSFYGFRVEAQNHRSGNWLIYFGIKDNPTSYFLEKKKLDKFIEVVTLSQQKINELKL